MPSERVLICGAGIAGSILAFWLAKHDFQVVVIERSKAEQRAGQGLEIEEPALTVVRQMGILDKLHEKKTGELGFELVDAQSRSCGILSAGGLSITGALELMRGDLTKVLYRAADASANVTYRFETVLHSLSQTADHVIVDLQNRQDKSITTEEFDFVVGADGARSRTRELVMGSPERLNYYKPLGVFCAYFSIPSKAQDWPYSQACNFPRRRIVWLRPMGKDSKMTSVYLLYAQSDAPKLRSANAAGDRQKQKEALAELYSGLGWQTPRVVEQMMKAENFYSEELVQVKLPKWSQDRVVLLGDSAWAPTPLTGEGNQLAIIGAWVLAQELSRNRDAVAFQRYEERLRSYVENAQEIPLGSYAPYIANPETEWGIWLLRAVFWLFSGTVRLLGWMGLAKTLSEKDHHPDFDLQIDDVAKGKGVQ